MKRHSFNVFSLAFGLTLIVLAGWIGFPARGWLFGTPRWLLPTLVILVGAVLMNPLFTSRDAGKRRSDESDGIEQDRPDVENGIGDPSGGTPEEG